MASMPCEIQEVYAKLGDVLDNPRAFGLGNTVPGPLAESLRAMRQKLGAVLKEQEEETGSDDLEAELSQDADRFCHANAWPS